MDASGEAIVRSRRVPLAAIGASHRLLQDGTSKKMTVQGSPPRFLPGIPEFVTTRGGEYFFKPGISAMRWLAQQG